LIVYPSVWGVLKYMVLRNVGTWHDKPEDHDLNLYLCENLKSHVHFISLILFLKVSGSSGYSLMPSICYWYV